MKTVQRSNKQTGYQANKEASRNFNLNMSKMQYLFVLEDYSCYDGDLKEQVTVRKIERIVNDFLELCKYSST